jgi:hypothetical protein
VLVFVLVSDVVGVGVIAFVDINVISAVGVLVTENDDCSDVTSALAVSILELPTPDVVQDVDINVESCVVDTVLELLISSDKIVVVVVVKVVSVVVDVVKQDESLNY